MDHSYSEINNIIFVFEDLRNITLENLLGIEEKENLVNENIDKILYLLLTNNCDGDDQYKYTESINY